MVSPSIFSTIDTSSNLSPLSRLNILLIICVWFKLSAYFNNTIIISIAFLSLPSLKNLYTLSDKPTTSILDISSLNKFPADNKYSKLKQSTKIIPYSLIKLNKACIAIFFSSTAFSELYSLKTLINISLRVTFNPTLNSINFFAASPWVFSSTSKILNSSYFDLWRGICFSSSFSIDIMYVSIIGSDNLFIGSLSFTSAICSVLVSSVGVTFDWESLVPNKLPKNPLLLLSSVFSGSDNDLGSCLGSSTGSGADDGGGGPDSGLVFTTRGSVFVPCLISGIGAGRDGWVDGADTCLVSATGGSAPDGFGATGGSAPGGFGSGGSAPGGFVSGGSSPGGFGSGCSAPGGFGATDGSAPGGFGSGGSSPGGFGATDGSSPGDDVSDLISASGDCSADVSDTIGGTGSEGGSDWFISVGLLSNCSAPPDCFEIDIISLGNSRLLPVEDFMSLR